MGCVEKSGTKRKKAMGFTENAKKRRSLGERDEEVDSSRCGQLDGKTVSVTNKEVVDPEVDEAERDHTIFYVSGIPLRVSREEVNIFFSSVCKVRKIDLTLDPSLRVPKAVAYIELDDPIYVSMAVDLSGQLLGGQPIEVKPLNVGNTSARERSYVHTSKKNFLDKPWEEMTLDERVDASTNWRELTDVENRRFFYNKLNGERSWSLPFELSVARNRAREAAQKFWTRYVPVSSLVQVHRNCQQVFGAPLPSQVAPAYPLPPHQYQFQAYPVPQFQYHAYPFSGRAIHSDVDTVSKANKEMVDPETGLTDEERDQRSVCVSGIPLRATRKEVDKFFSSVCKVRNIELLVDPGSRVAKAMGYIEFDDPIYVPMATDLSGQLLRGLPIEVKPLKVGNLFAGKRSFVQAGRKNFLNKPRGLMTWDERIDASTNWRELTDVENKRFFYNIVTGDRRWELPEELAVARNQAHEAARRSWVRSPEEAVAEEFFRHFNFQA